MYKGVVYFGVMVTADGPKLLEYNARFGDPETQVVLPLIKSDFGQLCSAMLGGRLRDYELELYAGSALGVAIVAGGYPGAYKKGIPVAIGDLGDRVLFHAQTVQGPERKVLTGGGRCFTLVAKAPSLAEAREKAYAGISAVDFEGSRYRYDIGAKYL
jgi:phosphoribosylamine-glycine ligase